MNRTIMAVAIGIAAVGGGAVSLPGAQAALSQCAADHACGWINENFVGLSVSRDATTPKSLSRLPDNDAITAIANKGSRAVGWYTDISMDGRRYCETPGDSNPNVGDSWNDRFSSLAVYSTRHC